MITKLAALTRRDYLSWSSVAFGWPGARCAEGPAYKTIH